ncbi:hypothetical protein TKK_0015031 [Trichogramma kaykai]|uniref:Uncharacterized protein n=1 Tax=Trichogramma kaykai TaxID=54128 RepID=A0ABD2WCM0_9HYME
MKNTGLAILLLTLILVEFRSVKCNPEPMMRPTRPKVFTSPEELRQYLELVKDYFTVHGKARYGKRADHQSRLINKNVYLSNLLEILMTLNMHNQLNEVEGRYESVENNKDDSHDGVNELLDKMHLFLE